MLHKLDPKFYSVTWYRANQSQAMITSFTEMPIGHQITKLVALVWNQSISMDVYKWVLSLGNDLANLVACYYFLVGIDIILLTHSKRYRNQILTMCFCQKSAFLNSYGRGLVDLTNSEYIYLTLTTDRVHNHAMHRLFSILYLTRKHDDILKYFLSKTPVWIASFNYVIFLT